MNLTNDTRLNDSFHLKRNCNGLITPIFISVKLSCFNYSFSLFNDDFDESQIF